MLDLFLMSNEGYAMLKTLLKKILQKEEKKLQDNQNAGEQKTNSCWLYTDKQPILPW